MYYLHFGHLAEAFVQTDFIHTLMVVAAKQGTNQHISSSLRFSILPKDTCRPGESNQ